MPLLIVADDLTGAADSAARCHHAGLPSTVLLDTTPPLPTGAVALSTDSRFLAPAVAAQRVRTLLAPLLHEDTIWYKKIDSTLRGNIGAEIDAMLALLAVDQPVAVVCPAFPDQGRGLVAGRLHFADAAANAPRLADLLTAQSDRATVEIALATVRSGIEPLVTALQAQVSAGAQLLVVDALSNEDVTTLVTATRLALPRALLVGSAGLIEPLARRLAEQAGPLVQYSQETTMLQSPILFVVGSGSAMAHRQLDALRIQEHLHVMTLGPDWATAYSEPAHGVAIHLPKPDENTSLEGENARTMAAQLAEAAIQLIDAVQPRTIVLVGGDTTSQVWEQLHMRQLTILAELMPGIPLLQGVDKDGRTRRFVTKAGNFGDEQTLVELMKLARPTHQ